MKDKLDSLQASLEFLPQSSKGVKPGLTKLHGQSHHHRRQLDLFHEPSSLARTREGQRLVPKWLLGVSAIITLATGTANMILVKWCGLMSAPRCADTLDPSCANALFNAPYSQQAGNCLGQAFCLLVHYVDRGVGRLNHRSCGVMEEFFDNTIPFQTPKRPAPKMHWLIPALCDAFGSILLLYALQISTASTVQVLRNFNLVVCALLSGFWLNAKLRIFHWLGILVMTCGFVLTGVDAAMVGAFDDNHHPWLGSLLSVCGTTLSAFQLVYEEFVFAKYSCSPFEAIGWIGAHEIYMTGLAILVAHYAGLENQIVTAYQATHNGWIITSLALFATSVALFSVFGATVTKLATAMLTATLWASRQLLVWIVELALGWNHFRWLAIFGMLSVLVGFFIYNHVIPEGCCPAYEHFMLKEWNWKCSCYFAGELMKAESVPPEDSTLDEDIVPVRRVKTLMPVARSMDSEGMNSHFATPCGTEDFGTETASSVSHLASKFTVVLPKKLHPPPLPPDAQVVIVGADQYNEAAIDGDVWLIIDKQEVPRNTRFDLPPLGLKDCVQHDE
eukprot:Blabericola_migrator_1__2815@NODE_1805_length_3768_cov_171_635774_g1162_i0_p1_GENE_NODE_1805_length_3768_cov_171_635774_g1162_i0NODE_1805_length_3768_cov_171_635774_g1162_i0_p1_ORF_typecomplete_len560_score88_62SLC35F/PF06027_12/7_2e31CRTlike/PF08627_10/3_2e27CRTlike/PF08627_10/7_4e02Nuc_sug_transp/PF04142_15/1_5e24TPT/PF03151_16/7_9e19UAA/PF08449_11/1_8e16PUNUT/PF16913_5/7_8e12EamA/PF00892_20/9_3e03EamA/PF00892_20/2_7e09EamA/PF00892_20/1_8e04Mg_trans_NIPA/PF05653_14/0_14_NODE_1805_length_3768_c